MHSAARYNADRAPEVMTNVCALVRIMRYSPNTVMVQLFLSIVLFGGTAISVLILLNIQLAVFKN